MKRRILVSALMAAMCILSCGDHITNTTTTVVPGVEYRVFGQVVDGAGDGAGNIGVVISGVGVCDTTASDTHGFYAFGGIPSGLYVVTVDTASASAHLYAVPDTTETIIVLGADEQVPNLLVRGPYVKNLLRVSFLDQDGVPIPRTSPANHYVYVYLGSRIDPASTGTAAYVYSYTVPLDYAALVSLNLYMGTSTSAVGSADVEIYAMSGARISKENIDLASGSVALTVDTPSLIGDIRTK